MSNAESDLKRLLGPIHAALDVAAGMLVDGDYEGLTIIDAGSPKADELRSIVEGYGHRLIRAPDRAYNELQVQAREGVSAPVFDVDFPLWTADEGRSHLVLTLSFSESDDIPDSVSIAFRRLSPRAGV